MTHNYKHDINAAALEYKCTVHNIYAPTTALQVQSDNEKNCSVIVL